VFNPDADRRNRAIRRVLRWGEFPPTRCLLRLDPGDPGEDNALEAHILVEATAVWPGIALQLGQLRIIGLPFVRGTPEAKGTGLLEHDEGLERVALLLAAGVVRLVRGIGGAVERSRRAIMPKRGG
jgi:hypothetical protein